MESSSNTKMMRTLWSQGHATHMQRHRIPKMLSKSGLIGVWHKYKLYLGTSTIKNRNLPTNINSWTRSDANLMITWSRNPHAKTPIPGKPSKSGLIGVWNKDNLYLGTNTIENGKPPPNEYWFANEKYKDDATKPIVLQ
jgi:hypothetical protein